jgi:hypothetical protein
MSLPNIDPTEWLLMSQDQVLDRFHGLNGSYSDGIGQKRFVYVAGKRKDRALLVAHADTVWYNAPLKIAHKDGILFSQNRQEKFEYNNKWDIKQTRTGIGIGADDRAGCAILWALRELGHSILITNGEEEGCVSTQWMIKHEWWQQELNDRHQFAVQFDRRNRNDIVFYDVGTQEFADYVSKETGYTPTGGFSTDIKHICKTVCGVNMSTGYVGEHTTEEKLVLDHFQNTLEAAHTWLSKDKLERFPLDKNKLLKLYSENTPYHLCNGYDDDYDVYSSNNRCASVTTDTSGRIIDRVIAENKNNSNLIQANDEELISCKHCKYQMLMSSWFENHFRCISCANEF